MGSFGLFNSGYIYCGDSKQKYLFQSSGRSSLLGSGGFEDMSHSTSREDFKSLESSLLPPFHQINENTTEFYTSKQISPVEVSKFGVGDTIGCGYNPLTQQLFWTKNGKYLGVPGGGKTRITTTKNKILFPSIGAENGNLIFQGNFGEKEFLFDYFHFINEFNESIKIKKNKINYLELHPYQEIFYPDFNKKNEQENSIHLILLSNITQFTMTLQVLVRAFTEFNKKFKTITLTPTNLHYYQQSQSPAGANQSINKSGSSINQNPIQGMKNNSEENLNFSYFEYFTENKIKDRTLKNIFSLLPMNFYGLNVRHCNQLSALFFIDLPNIERIRLLDLYGVEKLNDQTAEKLASICKNLVYLRLWGHATDQTLMHLLSLTNLRCLDVSDCKEITNLGIRAIVKHIPLTSLILDGCTKLTDECLIYISKKRKALEKLQIDRCSNFTERTLISFIKNANSLVSLSVAGIATEKMNVTDLLIKEIAENRGNKMCALNIYRSQITSKALFYLSSQCLFLEELNIGHTPVSDESIASLANIPTLRRIDLLHTDVSDATLHLLASKLNIEELALHWCEYLTVAGIASIIPLLNNCKYLCLKLTCADNSVVHLIASPENVAKLKRLDVRRTIVSSNVVHLLRLAKPNLIIYSDENNSIPRFIADGKNIPNWKYSTARVMTVRHRKNSK